MKKLFLTLITVLTLTSCTTDVEDRLLVYGIGVDYSDGEYTLSYQVFAPKGDAADSPVNISEKNVAVISAEAPTLKLCDRLLQQQTGKVIFAEDVEVIIMGESVDGDIAREIISEYISSKSVYVGTHVAFCVGSASDALSISKGGIGDPHAYEEILDSINSPRLLEIYNDLLFKGSAELTALKIEKDEEGELYPAGIGDARVING